MTDRLDEDRAALLAAMYDNEDLGSQHTSDPDKPEGEKRPTGIMNMPAMTHAIRALQKTVEEQDRMIKRMAQRIRNLERQTTKHTSSLNDLNSEIDNKIDRRGY